VALVPGSQRSRCRGYRVIVADKDAAGKVYGIDSYGFGSVISPLKFKEVVTDDC
jgi:hypothetical protein